MGIEKFKDRVIKVSIVTRNVVWEVLSCCCLPAVRSVNEK